MRETIALIVKVLAYMVVYGVLTILFSIGLFVFIIHFSQLATNCIHDDDFGCGMEGLMIFLMSGSCGFFMATILIGVLIMESEGNLDDKKTPTPALDEPSDTTDTLTTHP
jgi:hypothetical protein